MRRPLSPGLAGYMLEQWAPALVFLAMCFAAPISMLIGAAVLRVRARTVTPARLDSYECGEEVDGSAWIRFHPRYYIVALVFVLFDVEAAFLFPWAVSLEGAGWIALVDMFVFLGILLLGWAYAVKKEAIKWQ